VPLTPQQMADFQRLRQSYAPVVEAQRRKQQAQANLEKMHGLPPVRPQPKADGGSANLAQFLEGSHTPMRLYHGTTATEGGKRQEAVRRLKPSKEGAFGPGVYMTPDTEYATGYTGIPAMSQIKRDMAGDSDYARAGATKMLNRINKGEVESHEVGGNMLPLHARILNPLVVDMVGPGDPNVMALMTMGVSKDKAYDIVEKAYEKQGGPGKHVYTRAKALGHDAMIIKRNGKIQEVIHYNPKMIKSAIGNRGTYDTTKDDLSMAKGGSTHEIKATVKLGDRDLPITIDPWDKRAGRQIVHVNPKAFDKAFSKSSWQYVGPKGEGGIEGRYQKFADFAKDAPSVHASNADVNKEGGITFGDGRHRYAYLRDQGVQSIPMSMDKQSIQHARRHGYLHEAKGGSVMGINVASDRKAGIHYADLIVDGKKTIETRNGDTLRPYVGKRVAIVRTGAGPAKAIGEVTIGEPMVANKAKFRAMQSKHMVPEGSMFDITTPTKHLYPLHSPVRYDDERDVGHGIVSRKVIHEAKGGKIEVRPTVFDDAASRRNPKIEEAARALLAGNIKQKDYEKLVAKEKPVKPYDFIPKPATDEQAMDVLLDRQKQNWRSHEKWPAGHRVGLRLDIPAYERHGVWVNSVHDESGGQEKFPTSYGSVSSVRNATFEGSPHKAVRVATGEQTKTPFAKIKGELEHIDEDQAVKHFQKYMNHPDYRQIGYDPRRHGDFYDRETMQPVTHAEHVVQIGPLVLAKKPKYGKRTVYAKGGKVTHAHHLEIEERPL